MPTSYFSTRSSSPSLKRSRSSIAFY